MSVDNAAASSQGRTHFSKPTLIVILVIIISGIVFTWLHPRSAAYLCTAAGASLPTALVSKPLTIEHALYPGMSGHCSTADGFRTPIFKPSTMANSTLERNCSGDCVAFCICGLIESFFDTHVHPTIAKILVRGFGNQNRNDVFFALSDEKWRWPFAGPGLPSGRNQWADKGLPFPLPTRKEQCLAWHQFPVVDFMHDGSKMGQIAKAESCYNSILRMEERHSNQYDWVVRTRMDYRWFGMPFTTRTKHRCVAYNDQFRIWRRSAVPDKLGGREKFPCAEFSVPYPFRWWRANEAAGLKQTHFHQLHIWFLRSLWPNIEHASKHIKDEMAIHQMTLKWYECTSLVMTFACHRYWEFDLKYERNFPWEGLIHDKVAQSGMKPGDKIPDGDLFRMFLGNITIAKNNADLKKLLKVASIFLDAVNIDKHDTRSLRVHLLEFACDKPCGEGPYSRKSDQSAWRPQCLTKKLRNSLWNRASGMENSDIRLWGLC